MNVVMKRLGLWTLVVIAMVACQNTYSVFCNKYPVSFSCNTSIAPFNSINTMGYFLTVRPTSTKDGYKVKRPDGTEQEYPYTEVQNRVFSFGLAGLIIGVPYFGDGGVYAYDLGCPNCDRSSVRLTVNDEGVASCTKCGSIYDLNNSGMPKAVSERPLYRYRTTRNGNMLMIHN